MDEDYLSEARIEDWATSDEEPEDDLTTRWRRPVIVVVAVVVILSLALPVVYNLVDRGSPPVADNGLDICGFDYCVVQEAVVLSGLDLEMSRLANTILTDDGVTELANRMTDYLEIPTVPVSVVDELGGRLGGVFDPDSRSILIARPATAWTVIHEVAHAVATGHGADFQNVLMELIVAATPLVSAGAS